MPLSNEKRRELYRQRKTGTMVPKVVPKSVVLVPEVPNEVPKSVVPDVTDNTVTRIHKLEQVVSSLVLAVNALQREVGLIRKQQKFNTPDYNPESW